MEKNEMTFKSVNLRDPYIVDEDSKCLRQLYLMEVVYDLTTGETKLTWIEAETGDFVFGDLSDKQVYSGVEQFKKGELLKQTDLCVPKNFWEIVNYATPSRSVHKDGNGCFSWVYENGVATKFYYDERIGKITTTFGPDGCGARKIETDVEIPEIYYDAEEVYEFNDYEIVNNDGTKIFHEGLCRRLRLTKEQEALAEKLQGVINECKDAKMQISFDFGNCTLVAYNVAGVERIEYDPKVDDEIEEKHSLNLREAKSISGVHGINTDDDWYFIVKKDSLKTSK